MALDQYSICPCGSGKKIKFCKCVDNIQEMSKVERMMEGEQNVAALDRVNQLIKTFPSDAWLHAMKCEILLRLREIEPLEEASAKFIRLQPENPLAQMHRALLALLRGNVEECATLFWQGVSNTNENFHPMIFNVAVNLVTILAKRGQTLPALLQCEYLSEIVGEVEPIARAYEAITSMEHVNILSRESIPSPSETENAPWLERFREAYALLNRSRLGQAKTKLEAIQREFGPLPEILITLLHCKLLLVDMKGAAALCAKLAENPSIGAPQQAYFHALQIELEGPREDFQDEVYQYGFNDDAEIEAKLMASQFLTTLQNDELKQVVMAICSEEVPPKMLMALSLPIFGEKYGESKPKLLGGWVALFGRQTDKPPRLIIAESSAGLHSAIPAKIQQELNLCQRELIQRYPSKYYLSISTQVSLSQSISKDQQVEFITDLKRLVRDGFLDLHFSFLDGKSPRELKGNEAYRVKLLGLVTHWEGSGPANMLEGSDFRELLNELEIEQPKLSAEDDIFDHVGAASYFWVDRTSISPEALLTIMQSAMMRKVGVVYRDLVECSKRVQWPDDLKLAAEYTAYNMEVRVTSDMNVAEKILEQIYETGQKLGLPIGNAVLERVEILTQLGRQNEARLFMQRAFREVPEDPYLVQYLQMVQYEMQQRQAQGGGADLGNALLRHGANRSVPAPQSSGLWTPDKPAPAPSAPTENAAGGGSKLWIPGQ